MSADDSFDIPAVHLPPADDVTRSVNPYASPVDASPLVADVVATELVPRRPHPGIGMAIVWTGVLAMSQILFSLALVVPAMIFWVSQGKLGGEMEASLESLNGVMLLGATLTTLLCALAIARWMLGRDYLRLIGWRGFAPLQLVWVVLLVLPLGVIAGEAAALADEVLPSFGAMLDGMSALPLWLIFIGGCLFPALGEEIFFRGFMSRGVIGNHGVWIGAVFSSLLFGLMHIDPVQACGTFFLGLGFQYVFLTTRSLALPVVGHLLNNMLAFLIMRMEEAETGMIPTEVEHVPLIVGLAALAALPPLLGLLYQTRTRWILPDGSIWSAPFASTEAPPPSLGARPITAWPGAVLVLALVVTYVLLIASLAMSEW